MDLDRYFAAVEVMRANAIPGSYDAIYWGLELKHKGTLTSLQMHQRTMRRLRRRSA